jgi:hypothetical protein
MRTFSPRGRSAATVFLVAFGLFLGVAQAGGRREGEPFRWSGRLDAGQTLRVSGINGSIHAELAAGKDVVVEAEKWGGHSDPERVKIEVSQDARGVNICARYPRRWGGGLTDCNGFGTIGNNDVQVRFHVQVPAGVTARFANVNGPIEALGLHGPVAARTVNGAVHLETSEEADATTVNGSIVARARPGSQDLSFRTVNGSIRLELPADASAELHARTINGSLSSDFPVEMHGGWIGRRLLGRIGHGGPDVTLQTINGSISLREI